MKQTYKVLGVIAIAAVIGFSMAACGKGGKGDDGGGSGGFTLTGIPSEYNGKYAAIFVTGLTGDSKLTLFGVQTIGDKPPESATLPRISNGKVTIPMWQAKNEIRERYFGDDTATFIVGIIESLNYSQNGKDYSATHMFQGITFKNGSATKAWSDGI